MRVKSQHHFARRYPLIYAGLVGLAAAIGAGRTDMTVGAGIAVASVVAIGAGVWWAWRSSSPAASRRVR